MYSENHPLQREQYLRRALGDDLYEWLEEVSMRELVYDDFAWRCPECKYRADGGNVEFNHPQVECPNCKTISRVPEGILSKTGPHSISTAIESNFDKEAAEDGRGCTNQCECDESVAESDPNGLNAHDPGAKLDQGKPLAGLLQLFSRALKEIVKVGTFGAQKYTRGGWQHVENGIERYTDAMWRHLLEETIEAYDEDSGMLHAAQAAWNALARLELMLRAMEDCQRNKP